MTYIEKVVIWKKMDWFISICGTGNADLFAEKVGIKRRTIFKYLNQLRLWGAVIEYNSFRESYYYVMGQKPKLPIIPKENFDNLDD
jgi:biotin operon repressor